MNFLHLHHTTILQVRRLAAPARRIGEKFYAAFVPSRAVVPAVPAPLPVTPPAGVPLFKAHCSFLV